MGNLGPRDLLLDLLLLRLDMSPEEPLHPLANYEPADYAEL